MKGGEGLKGGDGMKGGDGSNHTEPGRVDPAYVHARLQAGQPPLLLVCAYEREVGFHKYRLEGAIPFGELQDRLPGLPKHTEIVFY